MVHATWASSSQRSPTLLSRSCKETECGCYRGECNGRSSPSTRYWSCGPGWAHYCPRAYFHRLWGRGWGSYSSQGSFLRLTLGFRNAACHCSSFDSHTTGKRRRRSSHRSCCSGRVHRSWPSGDACRRNSPRRFDLLEYSNSYCQLRGGPFC